MIYLGDATPDATTWAARRAPRMSVVLQPSQKDLNWALPVFPLCECFVAMARIDLVMVL